MSQLTFDSLVQRIDELKNQWSDALVQAEDLQRIKSDFLGPKGQVTELSRSVGLYPVEQRPQIGKAINALRRTLETQLSEKLEQVGQAKRAHNLKTDRLDMTLPGRARTPRGGLHPVTRVMYQVIDVFARLGFEVATGPEVELEHYNFEALNFPPDHPARDAQDTFLIRSLAPPLSGLLLRTHTSPVQIRTMERRGVPLRIIAPGRVYRCDSDATHSPMFHQVEVLCVDEGISFAHLKGTLTAFIQSFFGQRRVRFRPSFFPFVEPGAEVDMQCVLCDGTGCRLCKNTGWIEILGAGMVHPVLLESCGVDPEKYTGFAAGLGLDRIAMLRYGLDDLGHLFRSDVRFLSQF